MSTADTREVWQRGPVDGVPALLQPVAHALLQAVEEADRHTENLAPGNLWERPGNAASPGFHLRHMRGVVDRLFTYARGESLTAEQLKELAAENQVPDGMVHPRDLVDAFRREVDKAMLQLKDTPEAILTQRRTIGRKQIPTTVLGLLFHAAEHCQRHTGQLLVTVKILQAHHYSR